jgi:hypothetical protein
VASGTSLQLRLEGAPAFQLLEGQAPHPGTFFSATLLALAGFTVIALLFSSAPRYRARGVWDSQSQQANATSRTPNAQPSQAVSERTPEELSSAGRTVKGGQNPVGRASQSATSKDGAAHARADETESSAVATTLGTMQANSGPAKPEDATRAMIQAMQTHGIVMLGETHGVKQEYEWLDRLVSTSEFADNTDDIVVELGNSLYQSSVDRYIAGEDVPLEKVQKAWRNVVGEAGPPSPVIAEFYQAVRDANLRRKGRHQMRVVLGGPYADLDKIQSLEELGPYLGNRDSWYAQVVKDQVLARNHHALLIMGAGHFLRHNAPGEVEREIRAAGADPYLVVFGTNSVGSAQGPDNLNGHNLDKRNNSWPRPAIVPVAGNWVGDLAAMPVVTGGKVPATTLTLAGATDALLYVATRDALTESIMPQSELEGTAYGKELDRRMRIYLGHPTHYAHAEAEMPFFHSQPASDAALPPQLPAIPKSLNDPLPPRPPSQ